MKREQIIDILRQKLSVIVEQSDIPGGTIIGKKIIIGKEEAADAILALPLDVPSDEEIMQKYPFGDEIDLVSNLDNQDGAKWMKEEIIKRNN